MQTSPDPESSRPRLRGQLPYARAGSPAPGAAAGTGAASPPSAMVGLREAPGMGPKLVYWLRVLEGAVSTCPCYIHQKRCLQRGSRIALHSVTPNRQPARRSEEPSFATLPLLIHSPGFEPISSCPKRLAYESRQWQPEKALLPTPARAFGKCMDHSDSSRQREWPAIVPSSSSSEPLTACYYCESTQPTADAAQGNDFLSPL